MESPQGFARLFRFHVLRFVEDEDGTGLLDIFEGQAFAWEFFGGLEDDIGGLVEGVEGDDEDLDEGGGGEGAQLTQAGAVVFDQVDGFVFVEGAEVVAGDLEVLDPAFVDGDAGDDDDELAEAEAFAQFIDGSQSDVGFARARFHFDREGGMPPRLVAHAFKDHAVVYTQHACQIGGEIVALLDLAQVVVEPGFAERLERREVGDDLVAQFEIGALTRQAFEETRDGFDGVELVRLVGVELEFEGQVSSSRCQVSSFRSKVESQWSVVHRLSSNYFEIAPICQVDFGFIAQGGVETDEDVFIAQRNFRHRFGFDLFIEADVEVMTDELGRDLFDFVGFELRQRFYTAIEREALQEQNFCQEVFGRPAFDERGFGLTKTQFELGGVFA